MIATLWPVLFAGAVAQAPPEATPTPAASPAATASPAPSPVDDAGDEDLAGAVDDLDERLRELKRSVARASPGETAFVLTGYGFTGFDDEADAPSTFRSGFNPILLWRPSDRLLFEGELEIELEGEETVFALEYADAAWLVNDGVTVGAGKFLTPFGLFYERLHAAWINKLPETPMAFGHDGLVPDSMVGAQVRGGAPIGPIRIGYSAYIANGPGLETGALEPEEAGMVTAGSFDDENDDKAAGGRVAVLPIPALEIGYSVLRARVPAEGTSAAELGVLVQGVDLSYTRDSAALGGVIDLRAEAVLSQVEKTTYDPTGGLGFGPLTFDNRRTGTYVQLAWRPSRLGPSAVRKLELVARWDRLDRPEGAPEDEDETRWTGGIDYWLSPSVVLKAAFRSSIRETEGGPERADSVLTQLAVGF